MNRFWVFICLLSWFPAVYLNAQSQSPVDSLKAVLKIQKGEDRVDTYRQLFYKVKEEDLEEAVTYARKSLRLAIQLADAVGEGLAYRSLGHYHRFSPDLDSAKVYFEKSLTTLQKAENDKPLWGVTDEYVIVLAYTGDFTRAIEVCNLGLEVAKRLKSGGRIIDNLHRKASVYLEMSDYESATQSTLKAAKVLDTLIEPQPELAAFNTFFRGRTELLRENTPKAIALLAEATKKYRDINNVEWVAISLIEQGNAHNQAEEWARSIPLYEESLDLTRSLGRQDLVAANLGNIGATLMELGDYEGALPKIEEATTLTKEYGALNNLVVGYNDLGRVNLRMNNLENAVSWHTQAIVLADSIHAKLLLSEGFLGRSEAYAKAGNHKKALKDYKRHQKIRDSLFDKEKNKQIENLKIAYATDKKEQQIALQEAKIGLLQQRSRVNILVGILLLCALMISLVGYYAIRQKLKRNRAEREKLNGELQFKKRELTTHALHLAKKNQILEELRQKATALRPRAEHTGTHRQLIRTIEADLRSSSNWKSFLRYFEEVHSDFDAVIKQRLPQATSNDIRMLALIKMNLSTKEIANILNISTDGVKKARYRLRKKLQLKPEVSLQDFAGSL